MKVWRLLVVLTCYGASGLSLVFSLAFVALGLSQHRPGAWVMAVLVLLAWVGHLVMSLNWVLDRRMGRGVPVTCTVAALAAALLWPWMVWGEPAHRLDNMLGFSGLGLALALPSVLLAVVLVRFHGAEPRTDIGLGLTGPAACPPDA